MSDRFGTPTEDAFREVDALCPGSEPVATAALVRSAPSRRPPSFRDAAIILVLAGVPLAGGWGLGWLCSPRPTRREVKTTGVALPAISWPAVGTVLQSSGGNLAWVKVGPSSTAWVSFPAINVATPPLRLRDR